MAGLLSLMGGNRAQAPGQSMNPLQQLLDPTVALPMAAALMGNQGNAANFGNAFAAAGQGLSQRKQLQAQTAQKNQTLDYFRKSAPEFAQMVEAGMPMKEAWGAYLAQRKAQTGNTPTFSKTPIYGTDKDGNAVLGTIGDDGSFKRVDTGDFSVSTGVEKVDLGTQWGLLDKRSGQMVGTMPKENYQEAFDKGAGSAAGKAHGEAMASLPADMATSERTVAEIDQLLKHEGLSSIVGPFDQFRPSWTMGGQGRDALARFNQLKGRAFLSAYSMLKGGGQITEIEGVKAENAMARMDRAQNEEEFKQALKDFRDAVSDGMTKLKQRAGGVQPTQTVAPGSGGINQTSSGVQWSIEP
ncbi:hypothetical protein ABWH97_13885 [Nitratireductor sp. ac15]